MQNFFYILKVQDIEESQVAEFCKKKRIPFFSVTEANWKKIKGCMKKQKITNAGNEQD